VTALGRDRELKVFLLLQGRHIRKDGQMILLDQGFLEFIPMADGILRETRAAGQLRPDARVETVRSALMGAGKGCCATNSWHSEWVTQPPTARSKSVRSSAES
jgi:hypothetical protein